MANDKRQRLSKLQAGQALTAQDVADIAGVSDEVLADIGGPNLSALSAGDNNLRDWIKNVVREYQLVVDHAAARRAEIAAAKQ